MLETATPLLCHDRYPMFAALPVTPLNSLTMLTPAELERLACGSFTLRAMARMAAETNRSRLEDRYDIRVESECHSSQRYHHQSTAEIVAPGKRSPDVDISREFYAPVKRSRLDSFCEQKPLVSDTTALVKDSSSGSEPLCGRIRAGVFNVTLFRVEVFS